MLAATGTKAAGGLTVEDYSRRTFAPENFSASSALRNLASEMCV
jgi:hypothetical protein